MHWMIFSLFIQPKIGTFFIQFVRSLIFLDSNSFYQFSPVVSLYCSFLLASLFVCLVSSVVRELVLETRGRDFQSLTELQFSFFCPDKFKNDISICLFIHWLVLFLVSSFCHLYSYSAICSIFCSLVVSDSFPRSFVWLGGGLLKNPGIGWSRVHPEILGVIN